MGEKNLWQDDCVVDALYRETGTKERPHGMQPVGLMPTIIRITHKPTGTMAQVDSGRSQSKSRIIAMEMIEWALAASPAPPVKKGEGE